MFDAYVLAFVFSGALCAGFTTGLAGFGTALVAAGFWFHVLPAPLVPPVLVLSAAVGQFVGFFSVKRQLNWSRALPFLIGGIVGVPFGVLALAVISPDLLRTFVGGFLIVYAIVQLAGLVREQVNLPTGRHIDATIGLGGGFLGGFAGLSGPLPLIWLQLRGGPSADQRAIYQPFNMLVLGFSGLVMWLGGQCPPGTWSILALTLPGIIVGAWAGARFSTRVSEKMFRRVVLGLLLMSGLLLTSRAFA